MGIRNFTLATLLVLALAAAIAGCANSFTDQPNLATSGDKTAPGTSTTEEAPVMPDTGQTGTPSIKAPEITERRPSQTLPAGLERVETPEISPVVGEVPTKILDEILADLVQRTGADREAIQVVRAEAVVWNDGSLGCPQPGMAYIQILINGYWVVLLVEGVPYDYRVSDSEHFILCEAGNIIIEPVPLMPVAPHGKPPKGGWTQEP